MTIKPERKPSQFITLPADLIMAAKSGSGDHVQQLIDKLKPYTAAQLRRYRSCCQINPAVSGDDLQQAAAEALLYTLAQYDQSRETEPDTGRAFMALYRLYLKQVCLQQLGMRTTEREVIYNSTSIDKPAFADDPEGDTMADTIPDPAAVDPADRAAQSDTAHDIAQRLHEISRPMPADARAVYDLCAQGYSTAQAARILHIDRAEAGRQYRRALAWMRIRLPVRRLRDEYMPLSYSRRSSISRFINTGYSVVEEIIFSKENA